MKRLLYHISCLALVILPVLLTVAPAIAQTPVYQGQTIKLAIEEQTGDTYTWDLYSDSTINFATVDGTAVAEGLALFVDNENTGSSVQVTWLEAGVYFYKITAVNEAQCTNNLKVGRIEILPAIPTAQLDLNPNEICIEEPTILIVALTGNEPWSFTIQAEDLNGNITDLLEYNNILNDENPYEIILSPSQTTIYRVIQVKDKFGQNLDPSETITLTVHPLPTNSRIYQIDK